MQHLYHSSASLCRKKQIKKHQSWPMWCIMNMQIAKMWKNCANLKSQGKKCEIKGGSQDILLTTIKKNFCALLQVSLGLGTKFTWIVVIKIYAIKLSSQPFLGCHIWFHIFSPWLFGSAHFFHSLAVFV